ncbi:phage tail assembly chaperone [Pseudomonas sp. FP1740]|uniref:phage tail assembly chaperone n=1 Tax=Pseudomonas sp. FP1740 TaxID=2954078 RepID=UPI00273592D2|nr:phage tail assembly chaperone [Pseudomonas sp. FP1740]WLG43229.1 phage tail assembly chaperone [Pseudomonas sp. FP1740]
MASFKIAQNATFKAEVEIPRVGLDPVKVEFEFKYRDRKELSKYYDKWNAERDALIQESIKDGSTWEEATAGQIALEAGQLKDIVVGWNFEEAFTDEAITELVTTCVGAPAAVIEAYQAAYAVARRGN